MAVEVREKLWTYEDYVRGRRYHADRMIGFCE